VRAPPLGDERLEASAALRLSARTPLSPQSIRVSRSTFSQCTSAKWPINAGAASPQRLSSVLRAASLPRERRGAPAAATEGVS